jgi:hypothetical protein
LAADCDQLIDAEVTIGRLAPTKSDRRVSRSHMRRIAIGLGINSDAANPEPLERADCADSDFTAIGNQYGRKHIEVSSSLSLSRVPEQLFRSASKLADKIFGCTGRLNLLSSSRGLHAGTCEQD